MNIIVELVSPGRFFKDAPIHSLNECLKKRGFEVVFAADQADLVRVVENNARLAGVVIDWEDSPQELCQQIHDFNEYLRFRFLELQQCDGCHVPAALTQC